MCLATSLLSFCQSRNSLSCLLLFWIFLNGFFLFFGGRTGGGVCQTLKQEMHDLVLVLVGFQTHLSHVSCPVLSAKMGHRCCIIMEKDSACFSKEKRRNRNRPSMKMLW